MSQTARPETVRRLAMIDEGFVEDEAALGLGQAEHGQGGGNVAVPQAGRLVTRPGSQACELGFLEG